MFRLEMNRPLQNKKIPMKISKIIMKSRKRKQEKILCRNQYKIIIQQLNKLLKLKIHILKENQPKKSLM